MKLALPGWVGTGKATVLCGVQRQMVQGEKAGLTSTSCTQTSITTRPHYSRVLGSGYVLKKSDRCTSPSPTRHRGLLGTPEDAVFGLPLSVLIVSLSPVPREQQRDARPLNTPRSTLITVDCPLTAGQRGQTDRGTIQVICLGPCPQNEFHQDWNPKVWVHELSQATDTWKRSVPCG